MTRDELTVDHLPTMSLLQRLWLGFAGGIAVLAVVGVVAGPTRSTLPAVLPAALVGAGGLATIVGVVAVDRLFAAAPPADDQAALDAYRTRALLKAGLADAPVVLGLAISLVLGPGWVAAVGGGLALVALAISRPTPAAVHRIERAWQAQGHDVSILRGDVARGDESR